MTKEELNAVNYGAGSIQKQMKDAADFTKEDAALLEALEKPQRDPREAEIEDFTTVRAEQERKKGRNVTVVVMELDHSDGHVSNVVHGDLMHASKMCKHLSQDLAMRVIKQIANDMGFPIDGEAKA